MSQKTIADDPRLTAFVLNELSPADRAAFERQLADSPETAAEVALIREMADELRTALQSEPALPQTDFVMPARLVTSDAKVPSVGSVSDSFSPRHRWTSRVAVAASCLALLGTFSWVAWSGRAPSNIEDRLALAEYDAMGSHDSRDVTMRNLSLAQRQLGEQLHEVESFSVAEGAQPGPIVAWSDNASDYAVHDPQAHSWHFRSLNRDGAERFARQKARGSDAYFYKELKQLSDLASTVRLYALPALAGSQESKKRPDESDEFALRRKSLGLEKQVDELLEIEKLRRESEVVANAEAYVAIHDNPFASPLAEPLSTFSIDVDTAAYSNMRRFLTQGSWPPADSVRIEEMVNYFSYDYLPPGREGEAPAEPQKPSTSITAPARQEPRPPVNAPADAPFAVHLEVAGCPWNADHRLVRVGLKGKEIAVDKRPVSNIVFLIDVSGSMQDANKLPLVKAGLRRLVEQFNENDRVGIVVYAGASGLVLDSTIASQKDVILSSIENLQAGGSTNGGEGIQLAYALARKHFIEKGTNRVILCTDGDFNVGITNQDDLTRLIEEESKSGVFLSVLGFGMGNLKDSTLEKLADKGNGNYAYIDTLREANKVFVEQMTGTLITIAKDVKIQIEFNPSQVGAYRLIGYENRLLAAQDFHDDTKDAGEIGAGHTVTALYEIIPPSKLPAQPKEPVTEEKLKYQPNLKSPAGRSSQQPAVSSQPANLKSQISDLKSQSNELLTIKLRYKQPDADKSSLIEMPLTDDGRAFAKASTDFRFAASVASFGMILRHSPHRGNATLDAVAEIAQSSLGADKSGYRSEFVGLVRSAKALQK